jgi:Ca-activated chloride channel family protein
MKFAHPWWLGGALLALVVAAILVVGGLLLLRSLRGFGDEERMRALVTGRAGSRRAAKGLLLVLALAIAFVAAAQPQYGRGTRLIPATNLDVVLVLDFSKSMYARDVTPSRIARAQAEVGRLIADLPGARFGAVAFAGEPLSFPLTSDGSAIAQFFRQLVPNDMPVGGTAIARALESGRELLARDPLSKKHRRVMVLVTDGEDLEGDPVSVAKAAAGDQLTIHVVQIGGRTPEPIPEVNAAGDVTGWRQDENGQPVTTSLSAEGEATLSRLAETTGGMVVRATRGSTGIREVAAALKRMMSEELSEKVETVYADIFYYPLAVCILLLLGETLLGEVKARPRPALLPPPAHSPRRRGRRGERGRSALVTALALLLPLGAGSSGLTGCQSRDRVFSRHSPIVDQAIGALDAGDAAAASDALEQYLSTGKCEGGKLGTPDQVRKLPSASFDLGLALFQLGERFGRRFGEEEAGPDAGPEETATLGQRSEQVECALAVTRIVSTDRSVPVELRARAHYLSGNLEFLRKEYQAAISEYDQALTLVPGLAGDAGDGIGRDTAHNRALALRRLEEQEKNRDAGTDSGSDAGPDATPDGGQDAGEDSGDSGTGDDDAGPDSGDSGPDGGGGGDSAGADATPDQGGGSEGGDGQDAAPEPPKQPPEPQQASQDERVLDMLEEAPTLQEQEAKNRAGRRRVRGAMEDK